MSNQMEALSGKVRDNRAMRVLKNCWELQWKLTAQIKMKQAFSLLKNKCPSLPGKNLFLSFNYKTCKKTINFHMILLRLNTNVMQTSFVSRRIILAKRKFIKMCQRPNSCLLMDWTPRKRFLFAVVVEVKIM